MSLERLIQVIVERDPDTTGREIAEALWLTLVIAPARLSVSELTASPSLAVVPISDEDHTPNEDRTQEPPVPRSEPAPEHGTADLYPPNPDNYTGGRGNAVPIRTPSISALPHVAAIARALRPLRHRVPSRHRLKLDEKATAERSAEENALVPVMRPAQSRWLALHLIVDHGGAVMIWRDTIDELHRLLIRQGAFRDLRRWRFDSDADHQDLIFFAGPTSDIPRRANELCDPEGRHLVVVVSDCVGRAWHDGRIAKTLKLWARSGPMVLFQLMPPQLWDRTALGRTTMVRLSARAAGTANTRLIAVPADDWDEELPTNSVQTPVVTLSPETLAAWARMVVGMPEAEVAGYTFDAAIKSFATRAGRDAVLDAEEHVQRFLSLSTPTAQRLALLAAAAPVTLPILTLLRETFLPTAEHSHLAEVLLGGLLQRTSPTNVMDPDSIFYEFHPGVRERLLELAPFDQSTSVLNRISVYLEERAAHEREMRAAVALADDSGSTALLTEPFARIRSMLLRGLGYVHLAEAIDRLHATPPTLGPQPGADGGVQPNSDTASMAETPMLRLEEWLRVVGFERGNPFAKKQTEAEGSELQAYYIEHPTFSLLRETDVPRSVVLYASRGAGKSAARRMFEEHCIIFAPLIRPLMVSLIDWTWATEMGRPIEAITVRDHQEELFRQLVVALAQAHSQPFLTVPSDPDLLGYARWLCTTYGQYLVPSARQQLIDRGLLVTAERSALSSYDLFQLPTNRRLAMLVNVIRALGFKTCYVVVDCLDELAQTAHNWSLGAKLVAPLFGNLAMFETEGLVLRCFIPSEILAVLREDGVLREDRIQCVPLDWSDKAGNQLLYEMLSRRLQLFSDGQLRSLASLAVHDLRDLDGRLVAAARHSPRRLLTLGDLLFRACAASADSNNILIDMAHLDQALRQLASLPDEPQMDALAEQLLLVDTEEQASQLGKHDQIPLLELRSDGSIYRGASPIEGWQELPLRQRQLLEYLYQHRGAMCRKQDIIDHVWREYQLNDESALRKLADRLIMFLESDPAHPVYIEKIRGGHYMLKNTVA